jgi:hypothetical protein
VACNITRQVTQPTINDKYIMKTDNLITAALTGLIIVVATVLALSIPVSPDNLAGFVTVLMLLGLAALEYRSPSRPRLTARLK